MLESMLKRTAWGCSQPAQRFSYPAIRAGGACARLLSVAGNTVQPTGRSIEELASCHTLDQSVPKPWPRGPESCDLRPRSR